MLQEITSKVQKELGPSFMNEIIDAVSLLEAKAESQYAGNVSLLKKWPLF